MRLKRPARPTGFEPVTYCLEGSCSIRLSYGRIAVVEERRKLVGARGLSRPSLDSTLRAFCASRKSSVLLSCKTVGLVRRLLAPHSSRAPPPPPPRRPPPPPFLPPP